MWMRVLVWGGGNPKMPTCPHSRTHWCRCPLHAEDAGSLKALYRRGQAHTALGSHEAAVSDLEAALRLAEGDAVQWPLIAEKLGTAREKLAAAEKAAGGSAAAKKQQVLVEEDGVIEEVEEVQRPAARAAPMDYSNGCVIEEITETPAATSSSGRGSAAAASSGAGRPAAAAAAATAAATAAAAAASSSGRGAAAAAAMGAGMGGMPGGMGGMPGGMDPAQLRAAADMLSTNPDMFKQVRWADGVWGRYGPRLAFLSWVGGGWTCAMACGFAGRLASHAL